MKLLERGQKVRSSSKHLVLIIGCFFILISYQSSLYQNTRITLGDWPVFATLKTVTDPKSLLSYQQSYGFFDDILDEDWQKLQHKVKMMHPNTNGNPYSEKVHSPRSYFQNHYEPDFVCQHERRIGLLGDGGKWVCDPHRLSPRTNKMLFPLLDDEDPLVTGQPQTPACLVYSIGSNGEPSFEIGIRDTIGPHCEVHTFDFDHFPHLEGMNIGATFHQWGLTGDVSQTSQGPGEVGKRIFKTLYQTLEELGHIGRPIDIFKIDCEGCELSIFNDFYLPGIDLRQILVELHSSGGDDGNLKNAIPDFFTAMQQNGYVIFHKEFNIEYSDHAIEYCFLKLHPDFFQGINRTLGWEMQE